ncbi:bacillithiol biosynthesis deacetylase BshB1 [Segetibacter sp. 3557_3]|uniref:bacillithiol biosynthesis deacetylase BshB1 n=1 Tax=Segetibacter sp. 3557_3 TaxID=2547429 RepID=UPI0010584907|nr:bacillithiol biosynthesis deacetylase BshB1 [Segetibacter sp. 3557_3]TDH28933.1 bacillithiol biosynthesis deacetylase BshB1 [Segetibacter sp. 3557_3]
MHEKFYLLAFGVHPDDVELGCAGTILAAVAEGKKVGVVDLTRGELGTRGSAETRKQEAADAALVMGIAVRENLGMADGFFENNEENKRKIIQVIRKYRPEIVLANAPSDRHPDHGRSSKLLTEASFLSGLRKVITLDNGLEQEAWRPKYVFFYIQDRYLEPTFLVDISRVHDKKIEAIACYKTQFYNPDLDEPQTYLSSPEFLEAIKGRAMIFGKRIGVAFAEGFISEKSIGISSFDMLIQKNT